MAQIVILQPTPVALAGGVQTFLPGKVIKDTDYTPDEFARIQAAAAQPTASIDLPGGPSILNDAQAAAVATRLRGGDPENQTQGIMQGGLINYWF